jgi:Thiol:disulfide interchange protein DsbD, N-terminal
MKRISTAAALLALGLSAVAARAQASGPLQRFDNPDQSLVKQDTAVEFLYPEQITILAGKPSSIAMHFRVAPGLHINSHVPHDAYLIPTTLDMPASSGVQLLAATFPDGKDFTLPVDPKTHLSVYTGDFTVFARIRAPRGNHLVQARLHYQACNDNQCLPPRTIPIAIDVIAR